MDTLAGISMYFRQDKIHIRKNTIIALGTPQHVHIRVNEKKKLLFIEACERDKDSFRLSYRTDELLNSEDSVRAFINAKRLMDYLARLLGVGRYSESLKFPAVLMDSEQVIGVDLTQYEVIPYEY